MQYKLNQQYNNEIKKRMAKLDSNLVSTKNLNYRLDSEAKRVTKVIDLKFKKQSIWSLGRC